VPKKTLAKNSAHVDVTADDPVGTMDRFTEGLKRVLAAPKPKPKTRKHKRSG
jgi:hypothetical protein